MSSPCDPPVTAPEGPAQRRVGAEPRPFSVGRRHVVAGLGVALAASACAPRETATSSPAAAPPSSAPEPAAPAPVGPTAGAPVDAPHPLIIDTATRLNGSAVDGLAALGVQTVFRYYSYVPSNIRGKDLQPSESRAIHAAGLSTAVVFQHYNNCFETFRNDWGRRDAEQALRLAEANRQPAGSAVYFGVDGDWPFAGLIDGTIRYFEAVATAFQGTGLVVGAYGGGCILERLRVRGLADYFWLSGSTGFTGSQAFYNSGRWTLFQNQLDVTPARPRVGIDTNLCNPAASGDFGQFSDRGAAAAVHDADGTRRVFETRRFLRAGRDLLSAPDAAAPAIARLRIRSNVKLLSQGPDWSEVETQEGGASRRGPSRKGFLRTADLSPMDQIPGGVTTYGLCGADRPAPSTVSGANCTAAARGFRAL